MISLLLNGNWWTKNSWGFFLQARSQFMPSSLIQLPLLLFWPSSASWQQALTVPLLGLAFSQLPLLSCPSWFSDVCHQTSLPGEALTSPPAPQAETTDCACVRPWPCTVEHPSVVLLFQGTGSFYVSLPFSLFCQVVSSLITEAVCSSTTP